MIHVPSALAAEVTEFVGVDRDQRGQQVRVGYRNGHGELHVSTTAGPASLVLFGFAPGLRVGDVEAAADGHCYAVHRRRAP